MNTIIIYTKHIFFLCVLITPLLYTQEANAWGPFRNTKGHAGAVVADAQKAAIVKGKTTRVQILQELGDPTQKIDLGKGKVQFSHVMSTRSSGYMTHFKYPFGTDSSNLVKFTEFWVIFKKDIVEDFGEKPTNKRPKFF